MKTIIQFLRNQYTSNLEVLENIVVTNQNVENLNKLFLNNENVDNYNKRNLNITPLVQKNQIWTVKNEYIDKFDFMSNFKTEEYEKSSKYYEFHYKNVFK